LGRVVVENARIYCSAERGTGEVLFYSVFFKRFEAV